MSNRPGASLIWGVEITVTNASLRSTGVIDLDKAEELIEKYYFHPQIHVQSYRYWEELANIVIGHKKSFYSAYSECKALEQTLMPSPIWATSISTVLRQEGLEVPAPENFVWRLIPSFD